MTINNPIGGGPITDHFINGQVFSVPNMETQYRMIWHWNIIERLERRGVPKLDARTLAMALTPWAIPAYEAQVYALLDQVDQAADKWIEENCIKEMI